MMKVALIKTVTWNLVLISVGSVLCTAAINGILIPKQLISGGFTGLAILIHYLVPFLSVGVVYCILNIPVYVLGWKFVGRRFFLYSIAGLFIFSATVTWIHLTVPIQDKFLSALLAGIISGVGAGIILRSLGSAGGLDILSIILIKKFSIRLGSSILAFNCILLVVFAFIFSIEAALYALIFIFVSSKLVDLVATGLSQRKTAIIISDAWSDISNEIINTLQRGVTIVRGQGAYSGQEKPILYVVITFQELSRLKQFVRRIDPNAFVVISDTLEVMGQRIGNQPHW
ncbi:MAG: YitT family protein [Desulfobacterales bacterium]|jgi:uncharacterized membrane-anchored protein YitT (DUF2179 family)